jgi:hypothetical protein
MIVIVDEIPSTADGAAFATRALMDGGLDHERSAALIMMI